MSSVYYRPEIDGLRALAVLPVVLYHAGVPWLPGGFMGVDVFFVISGYLITSIIWREMEVGRFSIGRFYERRFRRIVPALLVVVVFVLLAVPSIALPSQVVDANKSAVAAVLSVSNFWFWTQSGYFAPAVEFMPLLHTWSLAVEEQFYVVFPLFLLAARRIGLDVRRWSLLMLPVLFAAAVFLSYEKPAAAFYLLPARAWELVLGAALALGAFPAIRSGSIASAMVLIGLLMLVTGYALGHSGMIFPGFLALLPCIGTALIIHCGNRASLAVSLLAWRPMVAVGLISYSLYLWHWPLLVFARMFTASASLSSGVAAFFVLAAIAVATLSWKFVEQPFRLSKFSLTKAIALCTGLAVAVVVISGAGVLAKGFPSRLGEQASRAIAAQNDLDPLRENCLGIRPVEACRFGGDSLPGYVVVGDSHAAAMRPAVEGVAALSQLRGEVWWRGACALLYGVKTVPRADVEQCAKFRAGALAEIESRPDIGLVILAGRWPSYMLGTNPEQGGSYRTFLAPEGGGGERSPESTIALFESSLEASVRKIIKSGKTVVLVGTAPEPGFDVPVLAALARLNGREISGAIPRRDVEARNRLVDRALAGIAKRLPNVYYVRIWDGFCDEKSCATQWRGLPIYSDDDHVSYRFSKERLSMILDSRWPQVGVED